MRPFRPMRPRREALPGLLIMVLIASAGVLLAVGVRGVLPRDLLETWTSPRLEVEDIEIDPATGLPIVPSNEYDEVWTWTLQQPNSRIDAANTWSSEAPGGSIDRGRWLVTLMATYPTFEAARAVAGELAEAVGDPAAELAWLEAAGVEPGDGFGWVGPEGSQTPFVQVVDRRLLVDGLDWQDAQDRWWSEWTEDTPPYRAPLAVALEDSASSLLIEDPFSEDAVAFDLVCSGDAEKLLTLGQDLADHRIGEGWRPPWIDPPLAPAEQKARRTWRLVNALWADAFIDAAMRSGEMERLSRAMASAAEREDFDAVRRIQQELGAHLKELAPSELPDLGSLTDVVDGDVLLMALEERLGAAADAGSDSHELLAAAEPFGAVHPASYGRDGSAYYDLLVEGRRLWLMGGSWFSVAQGFGPFTRYLDANGCDDVRVVLHSYADVRFD